MRSLQEQEAIMAIERLWADRRSRAKTQEFANLTVELLGRRQGPKIQWDGMRMGVKVEKPDTYTGAKGHGLDIWLF